jgi:hypothetical protein
MRGFKRCGSNWILNLYRPPPLRHRVVQVVPVRRVRGVRARQRGGLHDGVGVRQPVFHLPRLVHRVELRRRLEVRVVVRRGVDRAAPHAGEKAVSI